MLGILVVNGIVITMSGKGLGIIENGAVGIKENKIEVIGYTNEVMRQYKAHRIIDATGKVVMPGLIDAHIHTGIGILRGLAQDISNWMQKGLWPFMKELKEEEIKKGSLVNIIEGVKAGTTTFCDFDFPMRELVKNHIKIGTRTRVAECINELPENVSDLPVGEIYPFNPSIGQKKLNENIKLIEEWHGKENGRITCMLGPQGPDMLSKELLLTIKDLAEKYDTKIHMHVSQGDREINQMIKRYGKRSIPYLDELNYLDERLIAIHLTEATREETQLIAKRGASMILCSGSIGIIDGIVPPMAEFLEISEKAGLGSDQAPGNNCNNMFNEMKFTAILNKCKAKNPEVFPAWSVLKLATINAAKAIGLEDEIGSLEKGKKADLIIIDLDKPNLCPVFTDPIRNIVPNLVYSAKGNEVETVIIDGKVIVDNGVLTTIDEKEAIKQANEAAKNLSIRAKSNIIKSDITLLAAMEKGLL